jgi:hypothetical protein
MAAAIQGFALFLNQYANLLMALANLVLVLVTAVNVWLTRQTLKALREASLREREARHLQEIKDNVIQPAVSWIGLTLSQRFTGNTPRLLTLVGGDGGKPWQVSHTVEDPFSARQRLSTSADRHAQDPLATWTSTESDRISRFLYDHTLQEHFPEELQEFDGLLENVRRLTGSLIEFANECSRTAVGTDIPQALRQEDENSMTEWANPHLFVLECIHSLLLGKNDSGIRVQTFGSFCTLTTTENRPVAKATEPDKLKLWCQLGYEEMRRRWHGSDLPQRVRNLLERSESVRRKVEHLLFTHSLGVDCELVSGRRHRH